MTYLHRDEYRKKVQAEAKKMREEYGGAGAYADAHFQIIRKGNDIEDNWASSAAHYARMQSLANDEEFWRNMAFVFSCYEIQDNPPEEKLPPLEDLF